MRLTLAMLLLAGAASSAEKKAPPKDAALENDEQKTLYALGMVIGKNVAPFSLGSEDMKYVTMGLRDSLAMQNPKVDMKVFGPKIGEFQKARLAARAASERLKAKEFLDAAAKEKGVKVLPSGLIFKEVRGGKGAFPKADDKIKAQYQGSLRDGTIFDSTYRRSAPMEFSLKKVNACWSEALQLMKPGGKAKFFCPPGLAYGDMGNPPHIPGGAAIAFDVELLEIIEKK